MGNARTIASRTAIYGVGQALRGLASFIMLPIYTRHLVPADYGLVELLNVILDLTALLIGSRVAVGIFKYYSDAQDPKSKSQVLATALMLLVGANAVGVLVLWFGGGAIATLMNAPDGFEDALQAFAFTLVLAAVNEIFFSYLRILDRPIAYVLSNLVKLLIQLGLNIWFIVFLEMGYWGIIWASLLSSLAMTVLFAVWLGPSIGLSFSRFYAGKLVAYSLPIILASLGMYYITFGDRYFLKHFEGLAAVGIYALAYKFGFLLFSLVWTPFNTYWGAKQFDVAKQPDASRLFGQIFFYANLLLLTAAAGMVVVVPHFIRLFADQSYWQAIAVVPWIVAAYVVQCWDDYMRFGILNSEKTRYIAYGTLLTAVLITLFYWFWIPAEGVVGAAKATFWAFVFRFVFTLVVSQRLFPIEIPWARLTASILYLSAISWALSLWSLSDVAAMVVKGSLVLCAVALLAVSPMIEPAHRSLMQGAIRKKLLPRASSASQNKGGV